jgi:hypothetical protein
MHSQKSPESGQTRGETGIKAGVSFTRQPVCLTGRGGEGFKGDKAKTDCEEFITLVDPV